MKALSIRQPSAEAIMRGIKTVEFRSRGTKVRGRIYIYAALGRYHPDDEADLLEEFGMDDVDIETLPRGVVVGTVELHDCDGDEWLLRNPERAEELRRPVNHPMPVWFTPF